MSHPQSRRVITRSPENSETPVDSMRTWITPNSHFFVRNHFEVPELDESRWTLRLNVNADSERRLSWDLLDTMPQHNVFATLECAGNGRAFLEKRAPGVQWGAGAVGNAEWSGVRVRDLIDPEKMGDDALEIIFEGSDRGVEGGSDGEICFARSLPIDAALHPDTIIALRMNGEVLSVDHGYPARLIVPGWYGVASVKWLSGIRVTADPFRGFFQSVKYTVKRDTAMGVSEEVVGSMLPKSEITRPRPAERLSTGVHCVEGVAWAGREAVAAVESSFDGGESWRRAEMASPQQRYCWTNWRIEWTANEPGQYQLMARAISASGEIQPTQHNPLSGGYHINFSRPLEVGVFRKGADKVVEFAI